MSLPFLLSAGNFAFDVPWLAGLGGSGAVYAWLWAKARSRRRPHPTWKLLSFESGLLLVAVAVLSPLEHYGNSVLWLNFAGFLGLTMMAPPLLLLASPLTLAFRVASPAGRRRLRRLYRCRLATVLTFPVVSWLAFAVVTYVWQLTSLTDDAARQPFVRDLQQFMLLVVALWFWLPALAADPLRWRMAHPMRALYVFVEMTHKALFGAMFLSVTRPLHSHFAANLPSWAPSPILDQRIAIGVLWVGGNLIFLTVLVGIVVRWMQYETRSNHRLDRRLAMEREAERRRRAALGQVFDRPL